MGQVFGLLLCTWGSSYWLQQLGLSYCEHLGSDPTDGSALSLLSLSATLPFKYKNFKVILK